eukprot:CAMPEP_0176195396 /NCGR_PEP_ID=MMETSP0121_2-20121125/6491_1 /TAXON_ID=160619 /ORGANISM="Kryptoperidinium foliaceum, Strain CCMP 1326" /LENGTH=290 /DNA_ID=CAMNT_0017534165 /DNA_START=10 /DNA_END=879 /DNA_ORIENTATION=+
MTSVGQGSFDIRDPRAVVLTLHDEEDILSVLTSKAEDEDDAQDWGEGKPLLGLRRLSGRLVGRALFVAAWMSALMICLVGLGSYISSVAEKQRTFPAVAMLSSPAAHEAVTDILMSAAASVGSPIDRDAARSIVAGTLKSMSRHLQVELALAPVEVTADQQDAIMSCLALTVDPKVQDVGLHVARILRESNKSDRRTLKAELESYLVSDDSNVDELLDSAVPDYVRGIWSWDNMWAMTLSPQNLQMMRPAPHDALPGASTTRATALSQGAHELGLVLWDALAQIAHAPRE